MEIYLGIDGFDDSVSSKKLYKYYQNNENIIKDIGELNFGLFPFQNILSKFLNKVRIKYFLGCNIVSFTYSTLIKSKTTEPPIKCVVSKFFVNLPMKDEVLINFSKNGVDFSYWLYEIRNQLIQLFIEHNQPTDF